MSRFVRHGFLLLAVLVLSTQANLFGAEWLRSVGSSDAMPCVSCTLVVSLLEQLSVLHDKPIEKVMEEICGFFPKQFQESCDYLVNQYGDKIIDLVLAGEGPDDVCHHADFCTGFEQCRLYDGTKPPLYTEAKSYEAHRAAVQPKLAGRAVADAIKQKMQPLGETPWAWITALINRMANNHEPIEDMDGDNFSNYEYLRGSDWRGRDCNDLDRRIHAGRAKSSFSAAVDYDCNGISGTDAVTGKAYKDELCAGTGALGVVVVGDSGGAHFEVPPAWLTAATINESTYSDLYKVLADEFDLPHLSGYTGWTTPGVIVNGTDYSHSVYQYMRERNLCNHRDYQNCGVNGARSGAMKGLIKDIARNQTEDKPILLFYELIGNDVCAGNSLSSMTTVPEFTANILDSLNYFEANLPAGSHIVFVGLAPGELLWDLLNNRTHPIGVKYVEMYNYLNCLDISPCWEWMNSNATIRAAGTQRAHELSAVYPQIIANYSSKYTKFDMAYLDFPMETVIASWTATGGQPWELIEPVDGFHPNQIAHSLMADAYWNFLIQNHPTFISTVNPNNAKITQVFGDQGGY